MKLNRLFGGSKSTKILNEYCLELKKISRSRVLTESVNEDIVDRAISAGQFQNPRWTTQLLRGLKQVGVHGLEIPDDDRPITLGEMKRIVAFLLDTVGRK